MKICKVKLNILVLGYNIISNNIYIVYDSNFENLIIYDWVRLFDGFY